MKVLLGIILFHLFVIIRAKQQDGTAVPYFSTAIITGALVLFVIYMMYSMEMPEP